MISPDLMAEIASIVSVVFAILGTINRFTVFYKHSTGPWYLRVLLFITEMSVARSAGDPKRWKLPFVPRETKHAPTEDNCHQPRRHGDGDESFRGMREKLGRERPP